MSSHPQKGHTLLHPQSLSFLTVAGEQGWAEPLGVSSGSGPAGVVPALLHRNGGPSQTPRATSVPHARLHVSGPCRRRACAPAPSAPRPTFPQPLGHTPSPARQRALPGFQPQHTRGGRLGQDPGLGKAEKGYRGPCRAKGFTAEGLGGAERTQDGTQHRPAPCLVLPASGPGLSWMLRPSRQRTEGSWSVVNACVHSSHLRLPAEPCRTVGEDDPGHSPQAVLHDAVPAVSPAGAGMVALEQQGRLRHVELGQQPAVLGTGCRQDRA